MEKCQADCCQGLNRLIRIIWVYIGMFIRNNGALRAGK
jgi:hypothetical protein